MPTTLKDFINNQGNRQRTKTDDILFLEKFPELG